MKYFKACGSIHIESPILYEGALRSPTLDLIVDVRIFVDLLRKTQFKNSQTLDKKVLRFFSIFPQKYIKINV